MNSIGIMQGRLSSPIDGRIQDFPADNWRAEFALARSAGLDCIEWIYDENEADNPLRTDAGITEIRLLAQDTGLSVSSICADYYMARRLVGTDGIAQSAAMEHLAWLIGRAPSVGAKYVVLPFIDQSSLGSPEEVDGLSAVVTGVLPVAEQAGVELHLETDLEPAVLAGVLESLAHPLVRANLDTGNSAALGHDPVREMELLASWIGSVHVKDRLLRGGTVPLGMGASDLRTYFRLILGIGFSGPFILQAARVPDFDEVELGRQNRRLVEKLITMEGSC